MTMNQDQKFISRYIGQPASLTGDLRMRIEREWVNQPVQLYALADLDSEHRLRESWLALGPDHIALAQQHAKGEWSVRSVDRARITSIEESPGLSANTLRLIGGDDDAP